MLLIANEGPDDAGAASLLQYFIFFFCVARAEGDNCPVIRVFLLPVRGNVEAGGVDHLRSAGLRGPQDGNQTHQRVKAHALPTQIPIKPRVLHDGCLGQFIRAVFFLVRRKTNCIHMAFICCVDFLNFFCDDLTY